MIREQAGIRNCYKETPFLHWQITDVITKQIPWVKPPYSKVCFEHIPRNKHQHGKQHCRKQEFPLFLELKPFIETRKKRNAYCPEVNKDIQPVFHVLFLKPNS